MSSCKSLRRLWRWARFASLALVLMRVLVEEVVVVVVIMAVVLLLLMNSAMLDGQTPVLAQTHRVIPKSSIVVHLVRVTAGLQLSNLNGFEVFKGGTVPD